MGCDKTMITALSKARTETTFTTANREIRIAPNHILTNLTEERGQSSFSSRNTSKGALIEEAHAVFIAVKTGLTSIKARIAVRDGEILRSLFVRKQQQIWCATNFIKPCAKNWPQAIIWNWDEKFSRKQMYVSTSRI